MSGVPNKPLRPGGSGKLTLSLGTLVQPYRAKGKKVSGLTTADVAQILEDKYGIYAAFYRVNEQFVSNEITASLSGALQSLLMGQVVDPWGPAMQAIQSRFQDFINSRQAESVGLKGVPTKAALMGVNHRLKHPYARSNPRRPSFRDTGLYVRSFRSWVS